MSTPEIRRALPADATVLSAIALRAKAHWNYTPEQMQVFADELTLVPDELEEKTAFVLENDKIPLGFYTLVPHQDGVELEHIFVDPPHIGHGHGRALFMHACEQARTLGCRHMMIQSDPNAAGFYTALGCALIRQIPSSIPGRTIPLFHFELRDPS